MEKNPAKKPAAPDQPPDPMAHESLPHFDQAMNEAEKAVALAENVVASAISGNASEH